eukprot:CAMPEP_0197346202 /NCGR_PEP_ID=MMETSP0893-20130614/5393_1 /TAXON_ID=44058 ORGANISM="Aureoumbra lagunensis, Strain CCMP1510" /NCGR_SAMPLE_ID=MMETSP0893 /ASSEMBLY_ACC=CAM_ASM_000539 /LENGTH=37 /DNA_ID= /DNA_START= /DNA_END= /DNA_ORIENTATION=
MANELKPFKFTNNIFTNNFTSTIYTGTDFKTRSHAST